MYRLSARVPKPDNRYDYVSRYFQKLESALSLATDLFTRAAVEAVDIEKIKTED